MNLISSKLILLATILCSLLLMSSCNDNEDDPIESLSVAFESTSVGIDESSNSVNAIVAFTRATINNSQFTISLSENGVVYGEDYTTTPAAVNGVLFLDIPAGATNAVVVINSTAEAIDDGNNLVLTITDISGETDAQVTGNSNITINFSAIASSGSSMVAGIGGPTEPNQVFVDFSLNSQSIAERTSWDLGFFTGNEDKVIVNYSTYLMVKALDEIDLNAITAMDTVGLSNQMRIGTAGAHVFIDSPNGSLAELAIQDISAIDEENPVYIVNRGSGPGAGEIQLGSVNVGSNPLGWKKMRILKRGENYLIQHADINDGSFSETIISKDINFNFSYFNFDESNAVNVEPSLDKWDIVFSVSSNVIDFGAGLGAYGFSDFVRSNRQGGVTVARVDLETDENGTILPGQTTYDDFENSDLSNVSFLESANLIGSSWRSVFSRTANNSRFYLVRDIEGNTYKVQFLGLLNERGERGHSSFRYELL